MNVSHMVASTLLLSPILFAQSTQPESGLLSNMPRTCNPGAEYFATDVPAGQNKYVCTKTNVWTQQLAISQAIASAFSPVVFNKGGTLSQDNANFVWDAANSRLGLGNPTPSYRLDILGGSMRLNSGRTDAEAFRLAGRIGIGFPVPYFTPTTDNSIIAFDVYPKGNPANYSGNTGVAWFDLCSTDVNLNLGYECLRMGKFANGDAHVGIAASGSGAVRNLDLQINGGKVGIGTTSPAALLSVGRSSQFQVNTSGNITRLNNVATNFPAANASGYLTNDGAGNFYYTSITPSTAIAPSGAIAPSAATFTAATLPLNPPVGTIVQVSDGAGISDCTSGSGTVERFCEWNGSAWVFHPTGGYVLSSQPGTVPGNGTSFAAPGIATVSPTETFRQYVVAKSCQITNMYTNLGMDQPSSGNLTLTLRIASHGAPPADTGLTATIPAGAPAGTVVSDTTHTADVAAGDLVSVKLVNAAGIPSNLLTVNFYCAY